LFLKDFGKGNEAHVLNNILGMSRQVVAWRGAWEEIPQSIERNELRMINLDIFAQNIKHRPKMRSKITMKDIINDD